MADITLDQITNDLGKGHSVTRGNVLLVCRSCNPLATPDDLLGGSLPKVMVAILDTAAHLQAVNDPHPFLVITPQLRYALHYYLLAFWKHVDNAEHAWAVLSPAHTEIANAYAAWRDSQSQLCAQQNTATAQHDDFSQPPAGSEPAILELQRENRTRFAPRHIGASRQVCV